MNGRHRSRPRREVALAALGVVVSLALFAASVAGVPDPGPRVRDDAAREARLGAASIATGWAAIAASSAPPPGALGAPISTGPHRERDPAAGTTPGGANPATSAGRLAAALAGAARGEAVRGQLQGAISLAKEALAADPEGPERYALHLDMAGWWSRVGEPVQGAEHLAIAGSAPGEARRAGISVALLAALEQGDFTAAAQGLAAGNLSLPPPSGDRLVRGPAGLTLGPDPLWRVIEARLAEGGVDPETLDRAMARDQRIAAAAGRLVSAARPEIEPQAAWEVHSTVEGSVGARSTPAGGVQVVALDLERLHGALTDGALGGTPLVATFGATDEVPPGQPLHGPVPIPGLGASLTIHHRDLAGATAPLARRARWTRVGFAALGLVALLSSLAGVRTLRRERRLAELRTTFVASVSHDLRTPAQAILLLAEALDDERGLPADERERYQGQIRREAERLRRLVDDLLDGARIDRGEGPRVNAQDVPTASFLDALEGDARAHAERAGASFTMDRQGLPEHLWLDADGARRALWNLVENALRHGHRPGMPPEIQAAFSMEGDHLVALVSDRGPGVQGALRERAFDAFERLTQRGTSGEDIAGDTGTGLGLSIVRAIARAHGGDAAFVDPPTGRGATVRITFLQPSATDTQFP